MSGYRGGKVQPDDDENQPAMTCRKCFTPTPRYYRAGMPETPTVADMETRIRRSA